MAADIGRERPMPARWECELFDFNFFDAVQGRIRRHNGDGTFGRGHQGHQGRRISGFLRFLAAAGKREPLPEGLERTGVHAARLLERGIRFVRQHGDDDRLAAIPILRLAGVNVLERIGLKAAGGYAGVGDHHRAIQRERTKRTDRQNHTKPAEFKKC